MDDRVTLVEINIQMRQANDKESLRSTLGEMWLYCKRRQA
jgi:hypothetical protein